MRLPPLNPLKAFEATVRLGGFTAAATELGVSPPAVSMQVRKAEEYYGKRLFLRSHNALHLTDAGRQLYPSVSKALIELSVISDHLLENEARSSLVISTIQSLAVQWVAPAIAKFRELFPDVSIELRIEADPIDLERAQVDIRLTNESHLYPHNTTTLLFDDTVYPVCSHRFAKRHLAQTGFQSLPESSLIHTDWGESYASFPTWAAWFRAAGIIKTPDIRKGLRVGGTAVAAELALNNAGIALIPKRLFHGLHMRDGVVFPSEIGLALPYSFFAVTSAQHNQMTEPQKPKERMINAVLEMLKSGPSTVTTE